MKEIRRRFGLFQKVSENQPTRLIIFLNLLFASSFPGFRCLCIKAEMCADNCPKVSKTVFHSETDAGNSIKTEPQKNQPQQFGKR